MAWGIGVLASALAVMVLVATRVTTPLPDSPWFIASATIALAASVLVLLTGLPDLTGWIGGLGRTAPSVVITSPSPDQRVTHVVTVRGSARHIPHNTTLWLVVQAGHSLYPQAKVYLPPNGTGTWAQVAYFGRPEGTVGHQYVLYAVGADPAANALIEIYQQQKSAHSEPAPMTEAKGTYPKVATYAAVSAIRGP